MNMGKALVLGLAKLWAFIACFLAVTACASAGDGKINIGDKMDDFTLNDTGGKPHSLYQSQGKNATVVIFIATQCPYSNAFNQVMEQLYEEYQGKAVGFVAINANKTEPAAEVAQHAKAKGLKFLILKDDGSAIANRLGARATPEVYLLDSGMALRYHGALGNSKNPTTNPAVASSDEAKPAIEAVLAGKAVSVPTTKAFGCSIKR
jgi:peroxiredoxin